MEHYYEIDTEPTPVPFLFLFVGLPVLEFLLRSCS